MVAFAAPPPAPKPKETPAEATGRIVREMVRDTTGDESLAEDFGNAAWSKVEYESFLPGDVITAWSDVIRSNQTRRYWGKTVATNLNNRRIRAEESAAKIRADAEAERKRKAPVNLYPPVVISEETREKMRQIYAMQGTKVAN